MPFSEGESGGRGEAVIEEGFDGGFGDRGRSWRDETEETT